jgi:hypothetical protein
MWSVGDYLFQWWADGLRAPDKIFNIQSNYYGFSFDFHKFKLRKFGPVENPPSEPEALRQDNSLVESLPDMSIHASISRQGKASLVMGAGRTFEDCQLIESGRYFTRRWLTYLKLEPAIYSLDERESGLEICAWTDRVAFILRLTAKEQITETALQLVFNLPPGYSNFQAADGTGYFAGQNGQGFVFLGTSTQAVLSFDQDSGACMAHVEIDDWPAGEERTVGVIVYPSLDTREATARIVSQETHPLRVQAFQVHPEPHDLEVNYQREPGWYKIILRNDGDVADYAESSNHRIERVKVSVENPGPDSHTLRFNFAKDGRVFGITGFSAILRDMDGYPLGVPVQLSKNWHKGGTIDQSRRFEGPWFHGLISMTIPAHQKVEFEYTSVNAFWGTLPAASHAQLCLVGWGSNQQWDQAAIGSWGESLCFEPDQGQVGGAVLDTRPLMVWGMGNEPQRKWGWTNNVGGADFLVYYDRNGEKQANSRMKTMIQRSGPNLTEVTYAGTSFDQKIDLEYTVSLYRTDDITRGIYRFRYDIRDKVEFGKLVLFQCGSYDYSYTGERKFAYGNEAGMVKEWETHWGEFVYRTDRMELTGEIPWVSMHEAVKRGSDFGAWANRGLVVRHWNAKLGGQKTSPWIAEIGAPVRGEDTSLVDLLPPSGVTVLLPGDYLEAEIEHVIVPQFTADYYGPNDNLHQALATGENTWKMIYREAVGNHLDVKVARGGKLIRSYPIHIRSQGGEVVFSVSGGLGYVPVTISGLRDYRSFKMEYKVGGNWTEVDQSYHGNDYWQADYDPVTQSWELTYSLPLDSPQDQRQTRTFRLMQTAP